MDNSIPHENYEFKGAASPIKGSMEGSKELAFTSVGSESEGHEYDDVEIPPGFTLENLELKSNTVEELKVSDFPGLDPNYEPLKQNNYNLDYPVAVTDLTEQKDVGAENVNGKSDRKEAAGTGIAETKLTPVHIAQNMYAEGEVPTTESITMAPVRVLFEEKATNFVPEILEMNSNIASENIGSGKSLQESNCDPSYFEAEDGKNPAQPRKRKSVVKSVVTSSWSLRSKSQEKPKAPEPNDTVAADNANEEKKRRVRKKKQVNKNPTNEFMRIRSHLRYLLHRIRYEQNLIDAYSAEGWKGQSLEKLKPEKELERAKSHILRYKLKIRDLVQRLDQSLTEGKLPDSLFDSAGEIDSEDIFCAKCGSKDLPADNDIILCDGACERGFHQYCLDPPLLKEQIPPGDEGWICPGCDCKADCIGLLNDVQGTNLSILDSWEKIFPEAAAAASGKKLDDGSGSASDDSEDDDYDPDKPDKVEKVSGNESSSDDSDYYSASDGVVASPSKESHLGLPSDDSEDDDFDPAAPVQDEQPKQQSSSSDFTSDSEDLEALLDDADEPGSDPGCISSSSAGRQAFGSSKKGKTEVGGGKRQSLKDELSYLMETSDVPVSSKRHVERLDYKKLNDETYGNSTSDSSDEDFEGTTSRKRKKVNREESFLINSPTAENETVNKDKNLKQGEHSAERTHEELIGTPTSNSSRKAGSNSTSTKRSTAYKRLGEAVTQKLHESFKMNQYPERAVKENLAKELGLTFQQVDKWFGNARWSFNHKLQMESHTTQSGARDWLSSAQNTDKPPELEPTIITQNASSDGVSELEHSNARLTENHNPEVGVGNLVNGEANGQEPRVLRSTKMKAKKSKINDDMSSPNITQEQSLAVRRSSRIQTRSSDAVA